MTARHPSDKPNPPAQPANRAERRGRGKQAAPAPTGHGKVHGSKFTGPAPRQYHNRKHA
jgi:hypothetical protein